MAFWLTTVYFKAIEFSNRLQTCEESGHISVCLGPWFIVWKVNDLLVLNGTFW